MATPHSPQGRPEGHRRPRAWLARRMTAVLSVVAMLGLGGLMYWNDQQSAANPAPAVANAPINPATNSSTSSTNSSSSTSGTTSAKRSDHEDDGEHEHDGKHDDKSKGEHESHDDGGSVVDEIAGWISGSSNPSNPSNAGTAAQQTVPAPHTSTRGS